jgi:Tfp pilus assembly protein PilO
MKGGLQSMAPNAKRAFLTTIVLGVLAAAIYFLAVEPAIASLSRERTRLEELKESQRRMTTDLNSAGTVQKTLEELETEMKPFAAAVLKPLLGSYAMRAKSLLDPLISGAGLTDVEFSEEPTRKLPTPLPMPRQLHARATVRITAKGSYQAIASFLLMLEKNLPLVSLQSLQIQSQQNPTKQTTSMILAWPTKGALTRN